MIRTIAKLRSPWFGGKLTLVFASNFRRIRPETRMHLLAQAMKQLRAEHDLAAEHHRIERRDEDIANAAVASLRTEPAA